MIQTTTRLCVDVQAKYIHLQACSDLEINPRAHSIFFWSWKQKNIDNLLSIHLNNDNVKLFLRGVGTQS